jgi:hypothetical protein
MRYFARSRCGGAVGLRIPRKCMTGNSGQQSR